MLDYSVDGQISEDLEQTLACFDDANIYQTKAYAKVCYGERNISRLLVKKGSDPVAAALVRIRTIPFLPVGIAYVLGGPLWKMKGRNDIEHLSAAVNLIAREYVGRRGLVLRIRPFLYEDEASNRYENIFTNAGYRPLSHLPQQRTLVVDLNRPLGEIRKSIKGNWRGHLNRAERNNLSIIEGSDPELFEKLKPIHRELLNRKRLYDVKDVELFRKIQEELPSNMKMRVVLCEHQGLVCAGIIVSAIGKSGITLSRATNEFGRELRAAYLVQWRALQWIKDQGCHWYDLSGVNKDTNPGTYSYKSGLCGESGREVKMMPQYQICGNELTQGLMTLVDRGVKVIRQLY